MHEYLYGMLSKQKKLAEILNELKIDNLHKKNINLLIDLCRNLGTSFPYPILKSDLASQYEPYLIQLYVLFSQQTKEDSDLNNYLYKQIRLGLLYEKNAAALTEYIKNYPLPADFLKKYQLNSNMCILQLLIEPVQYFPRFSLLLNALINQFQLFKSEEYIDIINKLNLVHNKIKNLSMSLNKFLHCHYPEEIHLYFLERMVKENLSHNTSEIIDLCIEQTLRTDRLRILNEYIEVLLIFLNAHREHHRSYLSLFKNDSATLLITQEWKKFSPEYVKIFNENQHKKENPGLIFQEGVIKLHEKAIQLLMKAAQSHTEQIIKYSLVHYILAYIINLEDTILHFLDNPDYVPNLSTININEQLEKVGKENAEIQNKYDYYKNVYSTYSFNV